MIAIQGERGSYSETAALLLLGQAVEIKYCKNFKEVFVATSTQQVQGCLVPIENSLTGSIHKNYDLLLQHRLKITREINLPVHHSLIAFPGVSFSQIKTVMSHPVALDQCEKFFEKFPNLKRQSAYDTSGSVQRVMRQKIKTCAAIASSQAAEFHKAQVLMEGIEDNKENLTRFVLLSRRLKISTGADKTSVAFSFENKPGGLFKCISVFAQHQIDLMKIESRPIHGHPWEYLFYLDFLGNTEDEKTRAALSRLSKATNFLEILGCYPSARRDQK